MKSAISSGPRTRELFESASGQFPFNYFDMVGSVRVDHTLSETDSGYVRFNVADSHTQNQAAGALTAVMVATDGREPMLKKSMCSSSMGTQALASTWSPSTPVGIMA